MNREVLPIMVWLLAAIALLIGAGLTLIGLRGRRVDDHPICRRCGFDLIGLPSGSDTCSECGADLTRPRAIQRGHRSRKPVMLGLGALTLLIVFGFLAAVAWTHVRDLDRYRLMPTWYVLREARYNSPGIPVDAWRELLRRLGDDKLPKRHAAAATELALTIQGDRTRTWNTMIGDFIEAARDKGLATDAQWARYARQAPNLMVTLRPQVRRGDKLPARISAGAARVGGKSRLAIRVQNPAGHGDLIKPHDPKRSGFSYTVFGLSSGGGSSSSHVIELDRAAAATAPLGPREASLRAKITVREGWKENKPVLAAWEEEFKAGWELVAADAETIVLNNDESERAAVEKGTTVKFVGSRSPNARDYVNVEMDFKHLRVPLAHDIVLRDAGGREWKVTSINVSPGNMGYSTGGEAKDLDAATVDVIFRPSPAAARQTVHMTELWNHEFVVKNVPVQKPAPATRPRRAG